MSDPRLTPFNGHVAHVSLKDQLDAERFTAGEQMQIAASVAPLLQSPDGDMDRELLLGRNFLALDAENAAPWVYGIADRDGYCGWVHGSNLVGARATTHAVSVRESYFKATADLKTTGQTHPVFLGSEVCVTGALGDWSQIALDQAAAERPETFYLPSRHLRPASQPAKDPVEVARLFLGTPYLWGGNSGRGIDCSGLVQVAYHACGLACPGDSDQQAAMPGQQLDDATELGPGDLIFWNGHVAISTGLGTLIHTNAHHMNTVEEPISKVIQRIAASDTGPVTSRLRPDRIKLPTI